MEMSGLADMSQKVINLVHLIFIGSFVLILDEQIPVYWGPWWPNARAFLAGPVRIRHGRVNFT